MTLNDPKPRFQGHGVIFRPIDALILLCAQLTRDLFAIAKFLFVISPSIFGFDFDDNRCNRDVILRQRATFHPYRITRGRIMPSYRFSR